SSDLKPILHVCDCFFNEFEHIITTYMSLLPIASYFIVLLFSSFSRKHVLFFSLLPSLCDISQRLLPHRHQIEFSLFQSISLVCTLARRNSCCAIQSRLLLHVPSFLGSVPSPFAETPNLPWTMLRQ